MLCASRRALRSRTRSNRVMTVADKSERVRATSGFHLMKNVVWWCLFALWLANRGFFNPNNYLALPLVRLKKTSVRHLDQSSHLSLASTIRTHTHPCDLQSMSFCACARVCCELRAHRMHSARVRRPEKVTAHKLPHHTEHS